MSARGARAACPRRTERRDRAERVAHRHWRTAGPAPPALSPLRPVVANAIAEAVEPHQPLVAASGDVSAPVFGMGVHRPLQRFDDPRRVRRANALFDGGKREDRLAKGESERRPDFQDGEMRRDEVGERRLRLEVGRMGLVDDAGNLAQRRAQRRRLDPCRSRTLARCPCRRPAARPRRRRDPSPLRRRARRRPCGAGRRCAAPLPDASPPARRALPVSPPGIGTSVPIT